MEILREETSVAEANRARRFFREYYVYDLDQAGKLIFCCASEHRRKRAEPLFASLEEEDRGEWYEYLKSYQMLPAVAECCLGTVLVLPYLMPSASLAMVVVPDLKKSDFIKLALRDPRAPILLGKGLRSASLGRLHDAEGELTRAYEELMDMIERCYGHAEFGAHSVPCEIGGVLADRVEFLSRFLGFPISWRVRTKVINYGEVDEGLFLAYVTVILTMAKQDPTLKQAVFSLEERSYGCSVSVMLNGMKRGKKHPEDLFWMDHLASKKRVLFELTPLPNGLFLKFSPMSMDWSYLGLKQDIQYDDGSRDEK